MFYLHIDLEQESIPGTVRPGDFAIFSVGMPTPPPAIMLISFFQSLLFALLTVASPLAAEPVSVALCGLKYSKNLQARSRKQV